jgi:uncharacterized damage-inducible protein DinB
VRSLETIHGNLARARGELVRAADAVSREQWKTSPGKGRWSAGELVAHLITVEKAILSSADRLLQKPPRSLPFYRRYHLPMALVESRLIRTRTPISTDREVEDKEAMLAQLREVRSRTLAFIEETRGRDLRPYSMPHAFLGTLNIYAWLQLIASHEVRHTKQMREIAATLPKVVVNLQK